MAISEQTAAELFDLIRKQTAETAEVNRKLSSLVAKIEEKEKRCEDHTKKTDDHETRIRVIELWRAGQQGVTAVIQHWGPVFITAGIALYVAVRGHG